MAPGTGTQDEEAPKPPLRSKRLREKAELKDDSTSNGTDRDSKRTRSEPDDVNVDLRRNNEDAMKNLGIPGGENDPTRHRWKVHQMTEDYCELASNILLTPLSLLGSYGYNPSGLQYPLVNVSALQYLKSSLRRPMVIETWSPYEVAVFEAAIMEYGKDFHQIQKVIESKTTQEVIDFYYMWKKTSHYKKWKEQYVPPHLDVSDDELDFKKKK